MKRRRDEEVQRDEVILSVLFLPPAPGALSAELRFLWFASHVIVY